MSADKGQVLVAQLHLILAAAARRLVWQRDVLRPLSQRAQGRVPRLFVRAPRPSTACAARLSTGVRLGPPLAWCMHVPRTLRFFSFPNCSCAAGRLCLPIAAMTGLNS